MIGIGSPQLRCHQIGTGLRKTGCPDHIEHIKFSLLLVVLSTCSQGSWNFCEYATTNFALHKDLLLCVQ